MKNDIHTHGTAWPNDSGAVWSWALAIERFDCTAKKAYTASGRKPRSDVGSDPKARPELSAPLFTHSLCSLRRVWDSKLTASVPFAALLVRFAPKTACKGFESVSRVSAKRYTYPLQLS